MGQGASEGRYQESVRAPLPEIRDQAKGRWRAILPNFGVAATLLDGKQRACPICGGKDRFRFDDLEGHGTWYCNMCGAGNGMSLIMKMTGLLFAVAAAKVRKLLPDAPITPGKPLRDDAKCTAEMRRVWKSAVPIVGTMAESYLCSRGCWSDEVARMPALRFVPRLRAVDHESGWLPALVAKVTGSDGNPVNIHRTFLIDGRKAYRAMMPGPVPPGAAIRLGAALDRIGIAEGIETALHSAAMFNVTCWSAITAGGLERWEPPAGIDEVVICGDADASFTGQAAAYALARKLTVRRSPVACSVHIPNELGLDWADVGQRVSEAA